MTGRLQPMTDDRLDRLVRDALTLEAERIVAAQPRADVALAGLAARLRSRGATARRRQVTTLAWLALLLTAAVTAFVVGSLLLNEPRPSLLFTPYGPPRSCGELPVADGMPVQAFREEAGMWIDRSGLVTTISGDPADAPPEDEGAARGRIESRFVTGVLTPPGIAMVVEHVSAIGLEPGCYRVRTAGGDASIYANTPRGPLGLSFSSGNGEGDMARLIGPVEQARLQELVDSLFALETWLPASAFTPLEPSDLDTWVVHTTFRPSGFAGDAVVDLGDGIVASADDGRYAAVRLPGGVSVAEFGDPMPGALSIGEIIIHGYVDVRAPIQRCGLLGRADALILADSLDPMTLKVEGSPDLYTPDMATAITIRMHPAVGAHETCEGFAETINDVAVPSPAPSVPPVGNLAAVDPCGYVPPARFGVVETGWWSTSSPFGVEAPRCIIESHSSMSTGTVILVLWLYPRSVTEDDARALAAWIFGEGRNEQRIEGSPVWLNHCLAGGLTCQHAIAAHEGGHFLLLEISDRRSGTVATASALLGEILQGVR